MEFKNLTKNQIEDIYNNTVERYGREYLQANFYEGLYGMDEIDILLHGKSPSQILRNTSSDFNYFDDYFYYNAYGRLCSTNNAKEYYDDVIDMDYYVQWLISNYADEVKEYMEEEYDDPDYSMPDNGRIFRLNSVAEVKEFCPAKHCKYVDNNGEEFTVDELSECIHNSSYDYEDFIGEWTEIWEV